ncbi:Retrovirus-related Pol poly from transposon [Solea senegalensis]|uniref:Retrovirus-related Pol poly from transposon n=1 Tax=Solea senegalensis TaxID=28829 RepID=A0AAV6PMY7_SOLSE|nr:Retrovirus-related Pol poly from transposon [Solea senegalensis]
MSQEPLDLQALQGRMEQLQAENDRLRRDRDAAQTTSLQPRLDGSPDSSTSSQLAALTALVHKQQEQLNQITQTLAAMQKPPASQHSRPNIICRRCQRLGHYASDCENERSRPRPSSTVSAPQVVRGTAYIPVVNVGVSAVNLRPRCPIGLLSSAEVVSLPPGLCEVPEKEEHVTATIMSQTAGVSSVQKGAAGEHQHMAVQAAVLALPSRSPADLQALQEGDAAIGAFRHFWLDRRMPGLAEKEHLSLQGKAARTASAKLTIMSLNRTDSMAGDVDQLADQMLAHLSLKHLRHTASTSSSSVGRGYVGRVYRSGYSCGFSSFSSSEPFWDSAVEEPQDSSESVSEVSEDEEGLWVVLRGPVQHPPTAVQPSSQPREHVVPPQVEREASVPSPVPERASSSGSATLRKSSRTTAGQHSNPHRLPGQVGVYAVMATARHAAWR